MKSTLNEFSAVYIRVPGPTTGIPDPHADSHCGNDPELGVTVVFGTKPTGWFWKAERLGILWKGPYSTSEAAYDGFHDYMGWVRMDKVSP